MMGDKPVSHSVTGFSFGSKLFRDYEPTTLLKF